MDDDTPRMTQHARDRCAEMGISTKVAKHIWRNRTGTYPGHPGSGRRIAFSANPDYMLVYADTPDGPVVCSVVFRTDCRYIRNGTTYIRVEEKQ